MLINSALTAIIGFIIGVTSYYYLGIPQTIVEIREVEKIVERLVPVEKIKEIEVIKIIEKPITIIKKIPIVQKIDRIVFRMANSIHDIRVDNKSLECMTLNIYREANNQSLAGMIAVGRVVMNRVGDRRFPANPCDVIYEGPMRESWKTRKDPTLKKSERTFYPRRDRCQFSWYCDGKKDEVINKESNIKWKLAQQISYDILAYDRWAGIVEGATHYHATFVKPSWRKHLRLITKIDDHIFYRWQ
jgi:spore germination cell wall hydrolase CwlJ-like protein